MACQSAGHGARFDPNAGVAVRRNVRGVGDHQIGRVQKLGGDRIERLLEIALVHARSRYEAIGFEVLLTERNQNRIAFDESNSGSRSEVEQAESHRTGPPTEIDCESRHAIRSRRKGGEEKGIDVGAVPATRCRLKEPDAPSEESILGGVGVAWATARITS